MAQCIMAVVPAHLMVFRKQKVKGGGQDSILGMSLQGHAPNDLTSSF
jgi:hypothetical protein